MASTDMTRTESFGEHDCLGCRDDLPFDLPSGVLDACLDGDLVIFAGAGTSTESPLVVERSLHVEMTLELGLDPSDGLPFSQVMSAYEDAHSRLGLLGRLKKHLDYVKSFPKLDEEAGRFASELASIYPVKEIFTTNWDDYFERRCGSQPFVTEKDLAFWNSSERKVFKLHGSMSNPGSLVATEADYERCYHGLNEGLIGARLKMMLATKTVVFVGYSLRDNDLAALYGLIRDKLGDLLPRAYVVTVDDREPPAVASGMHAIRTSGIHFLHELKKAFPEDELLPDERFKAIPVMRAFVSDLHLDMIAKGEMREDPAMLMCACYQDGLTDAFDHQLANASKGNYFHPCYTERLVGQVYQDLQDERIDDGRWHTVAYIEGYMNGLLFLIADDETRAKMPLYYVHGYEGDLRTYEEYRTAAQQFPELSPEVYDYAKHFAGKLGPGIVFQHRPSL